MTDDVSFEAACAAIRDVMPRLSQILRTQDGGSARAVGSWTLADVAAHLSHVIERDRDALTGRPLPDVELLPTAVAGMTEEMLNADTEREPSALADRLDALSKQFVDVTAPYGLVTWIGQTRIPASAVACHLLLETLVHGHDVATAAGVPWPIEARHARLAVVGAVLPIIAASPHSWIRTDRDPNARARVELRLRNHERFVIELDRSLTVELPPTAARCDVHVSADAGALLLIMLGRLSLARALISGHVLAWGRRPLTALTLMKNVSPP